jgi:hypothetical protein
MGIISRLFRSHLKKVFSPDIGVEPSPQVLDIIEYACGLSIGFALISNENPNFEMASSVNEGRVSRLAPIETVWSQRVRGLRIQGFNSLFDILRFYFVSPWILFSN